MVYHGRVKNGVIVLEGDARLPEGAEVRVDVVSNGEKPAEPPESMYECFRSFIGSARNLSPDAARNVDHYLSGRPRE